MTDEQLRITDASGFQPDPHTMGQADQWLILALRILRYLERDDVADGLEAEVERLRSESTEQRAFADEYRAQLNETAADVERMRADIAESLPFLREAWEACFHGQNERMLSAEERGMGRLLFTFQAIADEKPAVPPGLVSLEECNRRVEAACEWAHRTLGDPNNLSADLQQWMLCGETCADGLRRAAAEVERLRSCVRDQLCDCHDEWGNRRPQPCERCRLLYQWETWNEADKAALAAERGK